MSETKKKHKKRAPYCDVRMEPKGTSLKPCDALSSVLSDSFRRGSGARIATMVRLASGIANQRLVISPAVKDGNGLIANFCPYCGMALTEIGAEEMERRMGEKKGSRAALPSSA